MRRRCYITERMRRRELVYYCLPSCAGEEKAEGMVDKDNAGEAGGGISLLLAPTPAPVPVLAVLDEMDEATDEATDEDEDEG